jgi:hypothetical protein
MADEDRRGARSPFVLTRGLQVDIIVQLRVDEELVIPASVEAMSEHTLTVRLPDGALGLAVGMRPRCTVLVRGDAQTHAVQARPGRRVDDVRSPTLLELVLTEPAVAGATLADQPVP